MDQPKPKAKSVYETYVAVPFTMHQLDEIHLNKPEPMTPDEIKELRLSFGVSQPVFAKYLNVKPVTIKKWELGAYKPNGTSLKLLQLIKRKGLFILQF